MKKLFYILMVIFILIDFLTSCTKEMKKENIEDIEEKKPIIATWINYNEIYELIKECDTQNDFDSLVNDKISILKNYNVNAIFLQVRAFDDCFYNSKIAPVSYYCSDENNKLKFDVLQVFIDVCRKNQIDIHAWINPYRIRNDNDLSKVTSSYAQNLLSNEDDERIIKTENYIYYNPSYIEIQNYILCFAKEIIENYDIDGIHIDDYFYPRKDESIDNKIYNDYKINGGVLSLDDYRRNCVNSLVVGLNYLCDKNDLLFSISPNADIDKNYNELYADVKLWMSDDGYADMIIPQIYYGFENESMPFKKVIDKWMSLDRNIKIIIGLPVYKIDNVDIYAGNGKNEWIDNKDVISRQILDSIRCGADGIAFYSASYLYNNSLQNNEQNRIIDYVSNWEYYVT